MPKRSAKSHSAVSYFPSLFQDHTMAGIVIETNTFAPLTMVQSSLVCDLVVGGRFESSVFVSEPAMHNGYIVYGSMLRRKYEHQ